MFKDQCQTIHGTGILTYIGVVEKRSIPAPPKGTLGWISIDPIAVSRHPLGGVGSSKINGCSGTSPWLIVSTSTSDGTLHDRRRPAQRPRLRTWWSASAPVRASPWSSASGRTCAGELVDGVLGVVLGLLGQSKSKKDLYITYHLYKSI